MKANQGVAVLHGTCYVNAGGSTFFFWSESESDTKRKGSFHPFSGSSADTKKLLSVKKLPPGTELGNNKLKAKFPSVEHYPLPSGELSGLVNMPDTTSDSITMDEWDISGISTDIGSAFSFLLNLENDDSSLIIGTDIKFWRAVTTYAYNILAEQKFLPTVMDDGISIRSRWSPILESYDDQKLFSEIAGRMPGACLSFNYGEIDPESLVRNYINNAVESVCRKSTISPPLPSGAGDILKWAISLSRGNSLTTYSRSLAIQKIASWSRMIQTRLESPLRMSFDLVPPEDQNDPWKLRFLLQSKTDPSIVIPFSSIWNRADKNVLSIINRFTEYPEEFLLQSLGVAQMIFPPIRKSLQTARPSEVLLSSEEVYRFLKEYSILLGDSGFSIMFPEWWGKAEKTPMLKVTVSPHENETGKLLGMQALVDYEFSVVVDGKPVSMKEVEKLAKLKSNLVQIGKKWVEIDRDQLKRVLDLMKRGMSGVPLNQLLTMSADNNLPPIEDIDAKDWLQGLFDKNARLGELDEPAGFTGKLRKYQKQGLSWLSFMSKIQMGSCLADDMGLGKTIEVIAFLLNRIRNDGIRGASLIICPTSVLSNWLHEIEKFAPELKAFIHQGALRWKDKAFIDNATNSDIVLTSYSVLQRDIQFISKVKWDGVIADEAQYIKNAGTKQSRAVRSISANFRIALTGTPIENRLEDLRSIFEFINPGYLLSEKKFREHFSTPISKFDDEEAAKKLNLLVNPFILRRVKTDQNIISDLPEKEEMKVFVPISEEQASLYEATVNAMLEDVKDADGIKRKGIVLATITKLKRLLDHPSMVTGDRNIEFERSQKLERLLEMLEETLENNEKTLIFTQYIEAGKIIKESILKRFHEESLFLSGSTPGIMREEMIRRFQEKDGPKTFIISVRAGGFGINLTAASNVIHFDRWWNPSVEDQATDRAYRIGQEKKVRVYKYISSGTIEEKIDQIIESKTSLSRKIVKATDESWITNLTGKELKEVFMLRASAVAAEVK